MKIRSLASGKRGMLLTHVTRGAVWNAVDTHQRKDMTSVIHGKVQTLHPAPQILPQLM